MAPLFRTLLGKATTSYTTTGGRHSKDTHKNASTPTLMPDLRRCETMQSTTRGPGYNGPCHSLMRTINQHGNFIRGPSNLPAVLLRTEEPKLKIIENLHGYVCYLLIGDKRSRYTLTFPLKSMPVPLTLVWAFLNVHGNTTARNRTIHTDGEISIAESTVIPTLGYLLQKTATDSLSQNGLAERAHQTSATMLVRCLLYSASLSTQFWPDALMYAT
jgi:hypothetical protein